jgi:hypothetical protein
MSRPPSFSPMAGGTTALPGTCLSSIRICPTRSKNYQPRSGCFGSWDAPAYRHGMSNSHPPGRPENVRRVRLNYCGGKL